MPAGPLSSSSATVGLAIATFRFKAYNRQGARTAGQPGYFDIGLTQTETTNFLENDDASAWANITDAPADAEVQDVEHGCFACIQESASLADNDVGVYILWGPNLEGVELTVNTGSNSSALNMVGYVSGGGLETDPSAGGFLEISGAGTPAPLAKLFGFMGQAVTTPIATGNEDLIFFDGWHGV